MKRNKYAVIGLLVILCITLNACVTEEVISTHEFEGGSAQRHHRIDSVQRVKPHVSPNPININQPKTPKNGVENENG